MKLRPYQEEIIDKTRQALKKHRRVLLQSPTGSGKTAITVYMMGRAAENGKRAFFLVHQNELLGQTSRALWEQKLEHGVIASGKRVSKLPAQVASVQTLVNRLEQYEPPDLIIIDECFAAGTILETDKGPTPIENISVGDIVMCYDGRSVIYSKVSDTWSTPSREILEIKTACGKLINCTGNHKLLTPSGWMRADQLTAGNLLFSASADAKKRFLKTNTDIRGDTSSGINHKKGQWKSGSKNITKCFYQCHIALADAVKKLDFCLVPRLNLSLIPKAQQKHSSISKGMIEEVRLGIIKYHLLRDKLFSEPFLGIHLFCSRTALQMPQEFAAIMGLSNTNGQCTKPEFYENFFQQLRDVKTEVMERNTSTPRQSQSNALTTFMPCVMKEKRKKYPKAGLMELGISGLLGGFVMMVRALEEGRRFTRKASQKKKTKKLLNGYQANTGQQILSGQEGGTLKYIFQRRLNGSFFQLLKNTYPKTCNTNWTPIESVRTLQDRETVYDITVPETENFFANGVLAHNCHRSSATTYQRILDAYPNAMVIGLTATPQRTDGKGLNDTYAEMVQGPSIRQLINAGFLCDYEIYAPPNVLDVSAIKTKMGDYDKAQLAEAVDKPTITGDAVATYRKRAHGKRCVVMCISIAHAEHVCASYLAASVPAELIEGKMTNAERELTLNRFRSGETLVICNVQLLIEGVDIPSIEVVQWLRPTQSIIVWLQGNGRGLRPSEGKERLIILDQVGNWTKHGLPDDDREWSLEGKKGRKKKDTEDPDVFVQQCKACFHVFRPGVDICPGCGAAVERKKKPEIQVIEGDIEKIDIEAERKRNRVEQGKSRTLSDLVALGSRRQLRKPAEWACATLAARDGRKPTTAMYAEARQILRGLNES